MTEQVIRTWERGTQMRADRPKNPGDQVKRSPFDGLRALFKFPSIGDSVDCGDDRLGTGVEAPVPEIEDHPWVVLDRSFGFLDVSGFTNLCEERGPHEAMALLAGFRATTRQVTARRGVRVAKWLGDGVMLVAAEGGPAVAATVELVERLGNDGVALHAGLARGDALLFEGDDYVGRAINIAARLCSLASSGEILAWGFQDADLPGWLESGGALDVSLDGVGTLSGVISLGSGAGFLPSTASPAA